MNLKALFSRTPARTAQREEIQPVRRANEIDATDLDACVGGRQETDGVGCYLRATNTRIT